MPLPTLVHSYQFRLGQRFLVTLDEASMAKTRWLHLKDTLTGYYAPDGGGSWLNPWVVRGSSNGSSFVACPSDPNTVVAAGGTGARNANDTWSLYTHINTAGPTSARSWIVLRQAGIAPKYEILIDFSQSNTGYFHKMISLYVSFNAGFTGGTLTARPTATDEYWFFRGGAEGGGTISYGFSGGLAESSYGSNLLGVHNIIQSTDGAITLIFLNYNGIYVPLHMAFFKPVNVHPLWTNPSLFWCPRQTPGGAWTIEQSIYGGAYDAAYSLCKVNGVLNSAYLNCESRQSVALGRVMTVPSDLDAAYPFLPIGIYAESTGTRARVGTLEDVFWGSTTPATGDTYPNDTSRLWCQMGDLIVPWNGTVPVVT